MEVKNEQMEWFIGGVLVLIIGIVSFIMTNNYHTLIAPVILFLYGVYRLVFDGDSQTHYFFRKFYCFSSDDF